MENPTVLPSENERETSPVSGQGAAEPGAAGSPSGAGPAAKPLDPDSITAFLEFVRNLEATVQQGLARATTAGLGDEYTAILNRLKGATGGSSLLAASPALGGLFQQTLLEILRLNGITVDRPGFYGARGNESEENSESATDTESENG